VKDENVDLLVDSHNILSTWKNYFCQLLNVRGPFEKFVDLPYSSELEFCGGVVMVSFSDVLLTMLHPLPENMLQTVCHKLQEDSGTGGFDLSCLFLCM
jgi:hypothetical protein